LRGSIYHTSLSEYGNDFADKAVADAHGQFVADLQAIEDEIVAFAFGKSSGSINRCTRSCELRAITASSAMIEDASIH
jgi:hypothetical protein